MSDDEKDRKAAEGSQDAPPDRTDDETTESGDERDRPRLALAPAPEEAVEPPASATDESTDDAVAAAAVTTPPEPGPAPGTEPPAGAPTWAAPGSALAGPSAPDVLDLHRRLAQQPRPWQPNDDLLDPSRDDGWSEAANHELVAIRPEDLPKLAVSNPTGAASAGARATDASAWGGPQVAVGVPAGTLETPPSATTSPFAPAPAIQSGVGMPDNVIQMTPAAVALAPADRRWRRGARRVRRGAATAIRPLVVIALFALGVGLGWTTYARADQMPIGPAAAPAATPEPGTTTAVPPQVVSLLAALTADDQTQIQTVVPADPFRRLAGELAVRHVTKIVGAQALQTYMDGDDTATEILIAGSDDQGGGGVFNLVVHVHNGQISDFR